MEIWRVIDFTEGAYSISNVGNLRNNRRAGKNLNPSSDEKGYKVSGMSYCGIKGKTHKIHRLVAQAFIPNPENKPFVNHINGIKDDNRVENLEWCTPRENTMHSYNIGLKKPILFEKDIIEIRENKDSLTGAQLAVKYRCSKSMISMILTNKTWNIDELQVGVSNKINGALIGRTVIDLATGIYYDSVSEAHRVYGKHSNTYFFAMLEGKKRNKTNYKLT